MAPVQVKTEGCWSILERIINASSSSHPSSSSSFNLTSFLSSLNISSSSLKRYNISDDKHDDLMEKIRWIGCADEVPKSYDMFTSLPLFAILFVLFLTLLTLTTACIYFEEIYFINKRFKIKNRAAKTIWILGFFPVFSLTGLIGTLVPRSGPLVDMVANVFFGTCLYNFGQLMMNYMGGAGRMWKLVEEDRKLKLNTPPVCCCCVCLPTVPFERRVFFRITFQIMQVAVVRPVLMFFAAVMWADGIYRPGDTSLRNGYIYVATINLLSTLLAVYGLMLTRGVLAKELQQQFSITGKIASLQLTLICSVVPNFIIGILVSNGVITCGPLLTSKGRGEVLYHIILVILMLPFSMMGRHFYRRACDGDGYAGSDKLGVPCFAGNEWDEPIVTQPCLMQTFRVQNDNNDNHDEGDSNERSRMPIPDNTPRNTVI